MFTRADVNSVSNEPLSRDSGLRLLQGNSNGLLGSEVNNATRCEGACDPRTLLCAGDRNNVLLWQQFWPKDTR